MASEVGSLLLVANPGSASRKYALYDAALTQRARLHFESLEDHSIACTIELDGVQSDVDVELDSLEAAASYVESIFVEKGVLSDDETIGYIGLRVVAPSSFFTRHHVITDEVVDQLESVLDLAPLHITATLAELKFLKGHFTNATIVGVSDSAFHLTKPSYAWNYAIDIHDADRYDIKRFGYHGLSVQGAIDALRSANRLPPKVVVCHLGSGSSVTAVYNGRSIDNTMGYTPLEGVVMATRSGTIDFGAVRALKSKLGLDDDGVEDYLHKSGGLLGLGGSNDIRELVSREANGDHLAHLALDTLVHSLHKAIGGMIATLGGADLIVLTGTVGERSVILRRRILAHFNSYDFILDGDTNDACTNPTDLTIVSQAAKSRPIVVIPADESRQIAKITLATVRTDTHNQP